MILGLSATTRLPAQAPHPTVIMAKVDGKMVQVVNAVRNKETFSFPVVEVGGKPQVIAAETPLLPERANAYSPGFVTFAKISFDDDRTGVGGSHGPAIFFGELNAVLNTSVSLHHGFLALVLYDRDFTETSEVDLPSRIMLQPLPDIAANTPVEIKAKIPFLAFQGTYDFFPLIFAEGGVEIRSNFGPKAAKFFSRVDKQRLAVFLKEYLRKSRGADRPAAPALNFQPILPEGVALPKEPIAATVTVNENGWVTDVQLPDGLDPPLSDGLRQTLGGWLFLPRLKAGHPVTSRVQVPLKF